MSPVQQRARAYYGRLMRTAALLESTPSTADHARVALGITKVSFYSHVAKLRALGYTVHETPVREGKRGPLATIFRVEQPAKR